MVLTLDEPWKPTIVVNNDISNSRIGSSTSVKAIPNSGSQTSAPTSFRSIGKRLINIHRPNCDNDNNAGCPCSLLLLDKLPGHPQSVLTPSLERALTCPPHPDEFFPTDPHIQLPSILRYVH
ncbi:hypothetical protein MLD38_035455 [Melastoma candidum]|uniref:Uncharacterized protein n=1 Tax=Melastoma candidum TaxID=119954 RepID=A0ACB9LGQ3_9MYRT|nr:hypothetical protein MLD38_035455 [Melastoma candidum]